MARIPYSNDQGGESIDSLTNEQITVATTKVKLTAGSTSLEVIPTAIECKGLVKLAAGIEFLDGTSMTTAPAVGGGGPTAMEWYCHFSRAGATHAAYAAAFDALAVQTNIAASVNKLNDWDSSVGADLISKSDVALTLYDGQSFNSLNGHFANMDAGRSLIRVVITHTSASQIRNWVQFAYQGDSHPGKSLHGGGIATGYFFNNAGGNSPINGATAVSEPSLIF